MFRLAVTWISEIFYHTTARSKLQTPRTNFCIRNFRGVRSFDLAIILLLGVVVRNRTT